MQVEVLPAVAALRANDLREALRLNSDKFRPLFAAVEKDLKGAYQSAQGGEVVSQVVETRKAIDNTSKGSPTSWAVIDGIPFQTNNLAVNTSAEAACRRALAVGHG